MKKFSPRFALALWLVAGFAALSAVIMLFAPSFTIVTWVGYASTMIAFIFTTFLTLLGYGSTDEGFTRLPMVRAAIVYVIVTAIASLIGTFAVYEADWHDFLRVELVVNGVCWCGMIITFFATRGKR